MVQGSLKIHTENILPIIKKWLYSEKDIFVRELVSNACDALFKVKTLRDHGETTATDDEFRVDLTIDKDARTLTITDTGIGMTADEVEKYIAQIAFSGAEEFVSKYKSSDEKDQIIGHFGLGFYSAYMVSENVTINTLSYRPEAESVLWSCDGTSTYNLDKGTRASRGTEITLLIDKESDE
ncbi:MAG TPA: ATP-binding protein, partial [Rhabdochlamydiaceae bacterium]